MSNESTNSTPISAKIYLLVSALLSLALVSVYFLDWISCLSSPYSINFEGPMIWAADALVRAQSIYPDSGLKSEPWISTIYPPLYLVFCAALLKLFGASYFPLRAASMFFCAGLAFLLFRIGKYGGFALSIILSVLTFYFSFEAVCIRSFEVRPDMMLVFFSVFMLERAFVLEMKQTESKLPFYQVLVLACISICIKQQAIVFVISLFLYWLLAGRRSLAIKFLLLWSGFVIAFTTLMQVCFPAYLDNLSFLSAVKSSKEVLISNLGSLGWDWLKVALALCLIPIGLLAAKRLEGIERLPFILVLVSTLLFLYSMGIPASSASHMMSAFFGLAWCLMISLRRLPVFCGIAVLLASAASFPVIAQEGIYRPKLLPFARESAARLAALELAGKPVLTDDVYLNIMTGSKPVLVDCATFLNVWSARGSGLEPLIEAIEKKKYAAIIINSNDSRLNKPLIWWPESLVKVVRANYRNAGELNCSGWGMDLYLP